MQFVGAFPVGGLPVDADEVFVDLAVVEIGQRGGQIEGAFELFGLQREGETDRGVDARIDQEPHVVAVFEIGQDVGQRGIFEDDRVVAPVAVVAGGDLFDDESQAFSAQ